MEHLDLENLDHDHELAAALGHMIIAWARAETVLVGVYATAFDVHTNTASAAYYNIPTFESRTKVLRATILERAKPLPKRDEMLSAIDKLIALSRTRNGWVHGVWTCLKEKPHVTRVFNMKVSSVARTATTVTKTSVMNHVSAVRQTTRDLERFVPVRLATRAP